ncbi:Calcium-binding EF hand-like protein [Quillaja saponaria]|uniref:Calcium-binding EF hand-like protein n=1 Tax=Quillaja saponaria TaxID=32244 RepID=A0AAD7PDU4_QUISA|nr:Calcium-binding EF hand-like protein [Quillaja saponaria]
MAATTAQNPATNLDLFDAYFRQADLDRDGRISGAEAVSFFQGSGLSKQVLAQIWAIANHSQSGFLGRTEFYNALKLVTVAQSKRELTPELVKAALYGPAAAKIPAPKINFTSAPATQFNSAAAPAPQISPVTPSSSQHFVFREQQVPSSVSGNQQNIPSLESQIERSPQSTSGSVSHMAPNVATQGFSGGVAVAGAQPASISSGWVGGITGGGPAGTASQVPARGISPSLTQDGFGLAPSGSTAVQPPRPQPTSGQLAKESKALDVSGNGFSSDSYFGGDTFSATSSQPKKDSSPQAFSAGNAFLSSAVVPVSAGTQQSVRPSIPHSLQGSLRTQPVTGQPQAPPLVRQNQQASIQTPNVSSPTGIPRESLNPASSQSQLQWPRMTQTDIQKYTKVFVEVDKDKDGKITGEQARNLFFSWGLPREVLKQVWDLSDQDNDSMLSLGEFCIALYLMERYREGRPLPAVLPSGILFELQTTSLPATHYNNTAWQPTSGFQQQPGMPGSVARPAKTAPAGRPPKPVAVPHSDERPQNKQQKSRVPVLEKHLVNQLSSDEQNSLNSKFKEATEAATKVEELEKEILDSKEKIEFYRTKMQELVLYKSRCDNRLNEITERVSSDKREAESLEKKYEEKCKQVGDIASKLTAEEARFRDIQEKKMELYQAIVKVEQDGSAGATLQARAEHIQSDLDELVRSLNDRCKKYGLRVKPMTLMELPFGWQPGMQEGAADWDEDWDKLEDEGFTFVKELTLDVKNVLAPPKQKLPAACKENASLVERPMDAASPKADDESEKLQTTDQRAVENGSEKNKSEDDSVKNAPNSPFARSVVGSPSRESPDSNIGKTIEDTSPQETQSDHGEGGSMFSGHQSFDERNWGTLGANDDIDSVWGFNFTSATKETGQDRNGDSYFFDSGELGLNPIRTSSSVAGDFPKKSGFSFDDSVPSTPLYGSTNSPQRSSGLFPKRSGFSFDDSVPSTPLYGSTNSPQRSSDLFPKRSGFSFDDSVPSTPQKSIDWSEPAFDNFSRFDSFRTSDSGFFPPHETYTRFDSMRSTSDFDHGHGFPAFDDSDPFGSGPFKTESQTPRGD